MATESQINTAAAGLLQLLDIKSGGVTPGELVNVLQPSFELSRHYMSQQIELETKTTAGIAASTDIDINVPIGERWYVHCVGSKCVRTAGGGDVTQSLQAQVQEQGFAPIVDSKRDTFGAANTEHYLSTGWKDYPIILLGGAELRLSVVDPGATVTATLYVAIRRITA